MTRTTASRLATIVALAIALLVGAPGAALAAELVASVPEPNQQAANAPDAVVLTFADETQAQHASITVVAPAGTVAQEGAATVEGRTVTQPLVRVRPNGIYTVRWSVEVPGQAQVSGQYVFSATENMPFVPSPKSGEPTPTPSPTTPAAQAAPVSHPSAVGAPVVMLVLLVLAVLGMVAAILASRRGGLARAVGIDRPVGDPDEEDRQ